MQKMSKKKRRKKKKKHERNVVEVCRLHYIFEIGEYTIDEDL